MSNKYSKIDRDYNRNRKVKFYKCLKCFKRDFMMSMKIDSIYASLNLHNPNSMMVNALFQNLMSRTSSLSLLGLNFMAL